MGEGAEALKMKLICKRCGAEMKKVKKEGMPVYVCGCREVGFDDGPPNDKMMGSTNDKSETVRK